MKSGSLNLLEPSGSVQACMWIALPNKAQEFTMVSLEITTAINMRGSFEYHFTSLHLVEILPLGGHPVPDNMITT